MIPQVVQTLAVRTSAHTSFRHDLGARGANLAHLMIAVDGETVTMVLGDDVAALALCASRLGLALKSARRAIHDYAGQLGRMSVHDIHEYGLPPGYSSGADLYEHGLRWMLLVKDPEPVTEIEAEFIE